MSSASSLGYAVSEQNHRIPFTIEAWQEFGITNTKDSESEGAGAGSYGGSQQMAPEVTSAANVYAVHNCPSNLTSVCWFPLCTLASQDLRGRLDS